MKTFLTLILLVIVIFDFFMVTPFGVYWTLTNLDEGKPCYGVLIMFITAIPAMIIYLVLGGK